MKILGFIELNFSQNDDALPKLIQQGVDPFHFRFLFERKAECHSALCGSVQP